jgi:SagB-type dehydrogenase family enzyme
LGAHVALDVHADGKVHASVQGYALPLGTLSAAAAERAQQLRTGLPLASFARDGKADAEIERLVRWLARRGLIEFVLPAATAARSSTGDDQIVIEPQLADYWPQTPPLDNDDMLVLSRFAYIRRRGDEMVLESPRAGALFRICNPNIAAGLVALSVPQPLKRLRRGENFPGVALLALLLDAGILFKVADADDLGLRPTEGDASLVLWDFHDLLFHARSTEGRHANPVGGTYPYTNTIAPLPAVRASWPGQKIDLRAALSGAKPAPFADLLRRRHSVRSFDARKPITLGELSRFLDGSARVLSHWTGGTDPDSDIPDVAYTMRPYPSAGACHELELYVAVDACDGLASGFYHYDADAHALSPIKVEPRDLDALFAGAELATGAAARPQILITITARFGRVSWKYSSLAYALILKDVGVLTQTLYLMATEMALGGCAIGSVNIEQFAKMTGIDWHVESPVGQFMLGRPEPAQAPAI